MKSATANCSCAGATAATINASCFLCSNVNLDDRCLLCLWEASSCWCDPRSVFLLSPAESDHIHAMRPLLLRHGCVLYLRCLPLLEGKASDLAVNATAEDVVVETTEMGLYQPCFLPPASRSIYSVSTVHMHPQHEEYTPW